MIVISLSNWEDDRKGIGYTVDKICFRLGLADARIHLFPRNWFKTGISSGKGPLGTDFAAPAARAGKAPCWIAASS